MKKNKQLILHIGTTKTGSTSIQQSLGKSRNALLEYDIYYPSIKPYNHIFSFPPIFVEDPVVIPWFRRTLKSTEDKDIKVQGYLKAWQNEFNTCDKENFIISAEHLTSPFFDEVAVKRLKNFVEPYFEKVTIIAYVRHYNAWIGSQYQQMIKNGNPGKHVQSLLNSPSSLSYRNRIKKWINVFRRENIVVRPFDPQVFYRGSLLADFFIACDLPADDISIPEIRSNESIGKHAVAFLQEYNRYYPVFKNGSANLERGLVRQGIPIALYNDLQDEKFELEMVYTAEQAQKFNQEIDFVNQFFKDGYQFHHVFPGKGEVGVPSADDIPVEFFVELINNYNKIIDSLQRKKQASRIPLRVINRLPFLKKVLQKILDL